MRVSVMREIDWAYKTAQANGGVAVLLDGIASWSPLDNAETMEKGGVVFAYITKNYSVAGDRYIFTPVNC